MCFWNVGLRGLEDTLSTKEYLSLSVMSKPKLLVAITGRYLISWHCSMCLAQTIRGANVAHCMPASQYCAHSWCSQWWKMRHLISIQLYSLQHGCQIFCLAQVVLSEEERSRATSINAAPKAMHPSYFQGNDNICKEHGNTT